MRPRLRLGHAAIGFLLLGLIAACAPASECSVGLTGRIGSCVRDRRPRRAG